MRGPDGNVYECSFGISLGDKDFADRLAEAFKAKGFLVIYEDAADTSQISDPDEKALAETLVQSGVFKVLGQYRVSTLFNADQEAPFKEVLKDILEIDLDAPGLPHDPDLF